MPIDRRAFIRDGALYLGGAALGGSWLALASARDRTIVPVVTVGLLADVHYADKDTIRTRHYRDSIEKIRQTVEGLNRLEVDVAVELGDLIDAADDSVDAQIDFLGRIDEELAKLECERHFVLGNHCVDILTKEEFVANSAAREPYYSFDSGGIHFVVLDACFRADGEPYGRRNATWQDTNIHPDEVAWLKHDLDESPRPTIAFVHQRLDETEHHSARNAAEVRAVLEASGRVLAVFQGHSHANHHAEVNGIHYCVVRATVEGPGNENSGYAELGVFEDGSMKLRGFVKQDSYDFR